VEKLTEVEKEDAKAIPDAVVSAAVSCKASGETGNGD
jgi:hypothetical protein